MAFRNYFTDIGDVKVDERFFNTILKLKERAIYLRIAKEIARSKASKVHILQRDFYDIASDNVVVKYLKDLRNLRLIDISKSVYRAERGFRFKNYYGLVLDKPVIIERRYIDLSIEKGLNPLEEVIYLTLAVLTKETGRIKYERKKFATFFSISNRTLLNMLDILIDNRLISRRQDVIFIEKG